MSTTKKDNRKKKKGERREYILCKSPRQRLFTADLLSADEGVDCDCDGAIDILRGAVFREAHFAEGFADAHDGFQVADLWGVLVVFVVEIGRLVFGFGGDVYGDGVSASCE